MGENIGFRLTEQGSNFSFNFFGSVHFWKNSMGRILLFFLWLVVVGAIARAIYVHRWEIAEDFIGYAVVAVIAGVVYVVKWLKASKTAQARNLGEKIENSYVPVFASLNLVLIFCAISIVLVLLMRSFVE